MPVIVRSRGTTPAVSIVSKCVPMITFESVHHQVAFSFDCSDEPMNHQATNEKINTQHVPSFTGSQKSEQKRRNTFQVSSCLILTNVGCVPAPLLGLLHSNNSHPIYQTDHILHLFKSMDFYQRFLCDFNHFTGIFLDPPGSKRFDPRTHRLSLRSACPCRFWVSFLLQVIHLSSPIRSKLGSV